MKKHKECNASIILRYTNMPYPPKITNKTKSGHIFLYPRERRHKNVPVTIVDPLVNTSSSEITVIVYSFLYAQRVVLCYTPGRPSVCLSVLTSPTLWG